MRGPITPQSTNTFKFAQCSNPSCRILFPFDTVDSFTDSNLLCSSCQQKIHSHHIVQCKNCESIINFLDIEDDETAVVFYVKKCRFCNGTFEDEKRIQLFMYPEIFM